MRTGSIATRQDSPADHETRIWPSREFVPSFIAEMEASDTPIIRPHECSRGIREAQGFLKGCGKSPVYSCNPYFGCEFSCSYCYSPACNRRILGFRGIQYWGKYVFTKDNLAKRLRSDLRRLARNCVR